MKENYKNTIFVEAEETAQRVCEYGCNTYDFRQLMHYLIDNPKKLERLVYAHTFGGNHVKVEFNDTRQWQATYFNNRHEALHTFVL